MFVGPNHGELKRTAGVRTRGKRVRVDGSAGLVGSLQDGGSFGLDKSDDGHEAMPAKTRSLVFAKPVKAL